MENNTTPNSTPPAGTKVDLQGIINTMMQVITNPVAFFREMPKSGGLADPVIFLVIMGVISGFIQAILALLGMGGSHASFGMVLFSVVMMPLMVVLFGFVIAAVMFVIWKLMGSEESYETAFRCIAYTSAISVITMFLNVIPYAGAILGLVWMMYLLVIASTEVHQIESRKAWIVFGIICAFLVVTSINGQHQARKMEKNVDEFSEKFEKSMEDMTPEEAGRAVGEFLKGMQETVEPEK